MTGYNALRYVQVNHLEAGICPEHGYLLTSEQCNCYPEETALMFAAEQTKSEGWEETARKLRNILAEPAPAILGSVGGECKKCVNGMTSNYPYNTHSITCSCCNGDYTCPNCAEEGTGNDVADLLAGMR